MYWWSWLHVSQFYDCIIQLMLVGRTTNLQEIPVQWHQTGMSWCWFGNCLSWHRSAYNHLSCITKIILTMQVANLNTRGMIDQILISLAINFSYCKMPLNLHQVSITSISLLIVMCSVIIDIQIQSSYCIMLVLLMCRGLSAVIRW